MNLNFDNLTPRQLRMVETPARTLWVGAGTKTGKSAAAHADCAKTALNGGRVCWVGPWSEQTFISYTFVKKILKPFIEKGILKANDSTMRIFRDDVCVFTPKTGDNADAIYGGAYDLVVIDEASRQTEESFTAAQTTVSATGGKIKLMFNLDHGQANWAIQNLLRVKALSAAARLESGEEFMIFPTGGEGLVPAAEIERVRKSMPEVIFNALYNAEIPETDLTLFRNLAEIFCGAPAPEEPELGHYYVAGMDIARKRN